MMKLLRLLLFCSKTRAHSMHNAKLKLERTTVGHRGMSPAYIEQNVMYSFCVRINVHRCY